MTFSWRRPNLLLHLPWQIARFLGVLESLELADADRQTPVEFTLEDSELLLCLRCSRLYEQFQDGADSKEQP